MIQITIHNELLLRLDQIPAHLREVAEKKFLYLIDEVYKKAIRQLSFGKYETTEEVEYGVEHQGSLLIGYMEPKSIKAKVQETGGKHWYDIYPTKAAVLRFIGRSGEVVFARHVLHPPLQGKHYLRDTIARELPHISEELREALGQVRL